MKRPPALAVGIALTLALIGAGPATAAAPQTSVSAISSEVMCPVCGTLLELAEAPQAQREKAFIARLVAAGRTKEQIKNALVAEYGEEVLAVPRGSGFELSAYLVPVVAFLIAVAALGLGVVRWRRTVEPAVSGGTASDGPSAEDRERLDADIARYDL